MLSQSLWRVESWGLTTLGNLFFRNLWSRILCLFLRFSPFSYIRWRVSFLSRSLLFGLSMFLMDWGVRFFAFILTFILAFMLFAFVAFVAFRWDYFPIRLLLAHLFLWRLDDFCLTLLWAAVLFLLFIGDLFLHGWIFWHSRRTVWNLILNHFEY